MVLGSLLSKNSFVRLLTIIIFAPVVVQIIAHGGFLLTCFMLVLVFLLGCEWSKLIEYEKNNLYYLYGLIYIMVPVLATLYLAEQADTSNVLTSILFMVWASDIGAYIVGNLIGGPKINIDISPNKTWSGYYGGLIFTSLVGLYLGINPGAAIFISILAQLGDFLESAIKRRFGVGNSGSLIPGHGGVLDRFDSFVLVTSFVALVHLIEQYSK